MNDSPQQSGHFLAPGMRRFTALCAWADTPKGEADEEIDVDAPDAREALGLAEAILRRDYVPGGRIVRLQERFGLYL